MSLHLYHTSAAQVQRDRTVEILRLLGRLEMARARWLQRLIFPDRTIRWCNMVLRQLHTQRLVWCASVPAARVPGVVAARNSQPPPKAPLLWGLSEAGRDWLLELGVEVGEGVELLRPRSWADPDLDLRTIRHDLLASDWCCAAIAGAHRHPGLIGVRVAVEYISARTPEGRERQRLDALLMLVFGQRPRTPAAHALSYLEEPPPADAVCCAFGLEIDMGSEQLSVLLGKAAMYRALTLSGHYHQTLGVPVLPVVLVPTTRRGRQIAAEWRTGWPGGAGVVATFQGAQVQGDAFRGHYVRMTDPAAQPVFLLDADGRISRAQWEAAIQHRGGDA